MIALLSWDLDLQREVHAGDRFETVLERRRDGEGNVVAYGDLVYVGLDTRERTIAAYRFTGPDGQVDFYDISWWRPINLATIDGTFAMEANAFKTHFAGIGVVK